MIFTKRMICGMYTVHQANEISKAFADDITFDFWEYIIPANETFFEVLQSLQRRQHGKEAVGQGYD